MTKVLLEQKLSKLRQDLLFKERLIAVTCFLFKSVFKFILHSSPQWVRAPSFMRFLDHTQRRTTVGRTALGE